MTLYMNMTRFVHENLGSWLGFKSRFEILGETGDDSVFESKNGELLDLYNWSFAKYLFQLSYAHFFGGIQGRYPLPGGFPFQAFNAQCWIIQGSPMKWHQVPRQKQLAKQ